MTLLQDFANEWGRRLSAPRRPLHLMIDIDDVLFPWADGIHQRCQDYGLHDGIPYTGWHMWEDYGVDKEDWIEVVTRATHDGFYLEPPIPGAVESLRGLAKDHYVHLVTARGFMRLGDQIREWTRQWVERYNVPHVTLTFAKDKVQAQHDLGVQFDVAVDDGPHNYEALDSAGVLVYLHDQPHNRHLDIERRIHSMGEFAHRVQLAAGGNHG